MRSLKQNWPKLGAALLFLLPGLLSAAPVNGVFTYHQPDGSKLSVKVKGDEFFAEEMTLDGQRVLQDPVTKFWCYAKLSADGTDLESTGIVASEGSARTFSSAESVPSYFRIKTPKEYRQRIDKLNREHLGRDRHGRLLHQAGESILPAAGVGTAPSVAAIQPISGNTLGTKRGLTLLIRFTDRAVDVTISRAQVDNYCNQTSSHYTEFGNNGSVSEYYSDVSNGKLTYTNAVADYYTAKQVRGYYTDETAARAPELVVEALNSLEASGFDFRTTDADGNGAIDALNVFYAGPVVNAWAKGLWPHASGLSWQSGKTGIKATSYQISNMGSALELGTFCHENGHMLCGFPDVYDYDEDSAGGSGAFDLMDAGCFGGNPCAPNGYMRYKAGWGSVEWMGSGVNSLKTLTAESGGRLVNQFLGYANPANAQEYFLMENRYKNDRDSGMPTGGIAVWHVDEQGDHNKQNYTHQTSHNNYEVALIQADNQRHLERYSNQGDAQDLFYAGNSASGYSNTFSDSSDTSAYDNNAHWWSGANSGLKLTSFSGQGNAMSFVIQTSGNAITGPAGYTWCAGENGSFTLPGTCDVAYGASGSFNYLYGKTGTITFNNDTFGDPISGVAKAGFYKVAQVTLTASAGANGAISPSGSVKVNSGSSQTFTITPSAGYTVNAVTVDGASVGAVGSYTFSNVTAAHSISATFTAIAGPAGYTWCAGEDGSFALPGTCDVAYGASGSFNYLYGKTGTITFNNATFGDPISGVGKAGFYKVAQLTLTASAGANGAISPSGSVKVNSGASQTFTITPSAGYTVSAVTVDGASVGAVGTYTFSNVTAAHTISATFTAIAGPAGYTWCAAENGSFTLPGTCDVAYGANGSFNYLTGKTGTIIFNNDTFGDPISGIVKSGFYKSSVTQYTLTASAGAGGAISPSGSVKVNQGASQTFAITPNAGYTVNAVTVDGASVGSVSSYTFSNVSAAHTISVTFNAPPVGPAGYTWCASENGSFALPGTCDVAYGANGSFNYLSGKTGTITFNNDTFGDPISGTVKAGYYKVSTTPVQYTLTASAGANGAITPSGSVSVSQGASQAFTITPSAGYVISAVTVDGASVGAVASYTFSSVSAAHTISATFAQSGAAAWATGVHYPLNALVTYGGKTWKNTFDHTSQADWYPGAPGIWFWVAQ